MLPLRPPDTVPRPTHPGGVVHVCALPAPGHGPGSNCSSAVACQHTHVRQYLMGCETSAAERASRRVRFVRTRSFGLMMMSGSLAGHVIRTCVDVGWLELARETTLIFCRCLVGRRHNLNQIWRAQF